MANRRVLVGAHLACPEVVAVAEKVIKHDNLDLAVMAVAEDPDVQFDAVPLGNGIIDISWVGRDVILGGFGTQGDGTSPGRRTFVEEPITALSADSIVVSGNGISGACEGDSGGPLLTKDSAGNAVLIGILASGSASCRGEDRFTRLDIVSDWLADNLDP